MLRWVSPFNHRIIIHYLTGCYWLASPVLLSGLWRHRSFSSLINWQLPPERPGATRVKEFGNMRPGSALREGEDRVHWSVVSGQWSTDSGQWSVLHTAAELDAYCCSVSSSLCLESAIRIMVNSFLLILPSRLKSQPRRIVVWNSSRSLAS